MLKGIVVFLVTTLCQSYFVFSQFGNFTLTIEWLPGEGGYFSCGCECLRHWVVWHSFISRMFP